jgi:hypothetical protein
MPVCNLLLLKDFFKRFFRNEITRSGYSAQFIALESSMIRVAKNLTQSGTNNDIG